MPDQDLKLGSYEAGKITIEPTSIRGEGGPEYPRLIVPLNLNLNPIVEEYGSNKTYNYLILTVQCSLLIPNHPAKIADAMPYTNPFRVYSQHATSILNIEFPLDHYRIEKIEEKRKQDLQMQLDFRFVIATYEKIKTNEKEETRDIFTDYKDSWARFDIEIPQSHWLKVLKSFGYGFTKILELPNTSRIIGRDFAKSINEINLAQEYFNTGDYDKAVAHCRSAIEPIKNKLPELKKRIESDTEYAWVKEIGNATYDWIEKLYQKTRDLTSKAHHLPSVGHFSRHDAEPIMLVTIALLAYAGRLSEPTPKNEE